MVLRRTVWNCVTRVTRPTKWIERHKCFITVWSWMSGWLAGCLSKSASKDVGEHFARRTIPNNNWIIIQFKVYRIGKYSRQLLCPISRMFFRKSRGRSCVKEEGQRMVCIACDLGGKLLNFRLIAENQIQSSALREFLGHTRGGWSATDQTVTVGVHRCSSRKLLLKIQEILL